MPIQLKVAHMKIRPNRTITKRDGPGDLSAGTSYTFANTRSIIAETIATIPIRGYQHSERGCLQPSGAR